MASQQLMGRVKENLEARFRGCTVHIERGGAADRVADWTGWAGFEGMDHVDRQMRMKEAFTELSEEDRLNIGPILALTPREAYDDEEAA